MGVTSTVTLAYEGAPACRDCQRDGIPVCDHVGFNDAGWVGIPGTAVHAPGLDRSYDHVVRDVEISADRKTVTLTTETQLPEYHDLARHLSVRADYRAKAWVRAVDEGGNTIEEGHYDRPLTAGEIITRDRDPYLVVSISHPNRDEVTGVARDPGDLQIAVLRPIPVDPITPVDSSVSLPGGVAFG